SSDACSSDLGRVPFQRLVQGLRRRKRDPSEPADGRCLRRHTTLIYAIAAVSALRAAFAATYVRSRGRLALPAAPAGQLPESAGIRRQLEAGAGTREPVRAAAPPEEHAWRAPGPIGRCAAARARRLAPAAWISVVVATAGGEPMAADGGWFRIPQTRVGVVAVAIVLP